MQVCLTIVFQFKGIASIRYIQEKYKLFASLNCRSASCLSSFICMDLVSLLRLYIFTYRVLRYSNPSEISFVGLTFWNTSSSVASLLLVVELPSLASFSIFFWIKLTTKVSFLGNLIKILTNVTHVIFCINVQCKFNQKITTLIST